MENSEKHKDTTNNIYPKNSESSKKIKEYSLHNESNINEIKKNLNDLTQKSATNLENNVGVSKKKNKIKKMKSAQQLDNKNYNIERNISKSKKSKPIIETLENLIHKKEELINGGQLNNENNESNKNIGSNGTNESLKVKSKFSPEMNLNNSSKENEQNKIQKFVSKKHDESFDSNDSKQSLEKEITSMNSNIFHSGGKQNAEGVKFMAEDIIDYNNYSDNNPINNKYSNKSIKKITSKSRRTAEFEYRRMDNSSKRHSLKTFDKKSNKNEINFGDLLFSYYNETKRTNENNLGSNANSLFNHDEINNNKYINFNNYDDINNNMFVFDTMYDTFGNQEKPNSNNNNNNNSKRKSKKLDSNELNDRINRNIEAINKDKSNKEEGTENCEFTNKDNTNNENKNTNSPTNISRNTNEKHIQGSIPTASKAQCKIKASSINKSKDKKCKRGSVVFNIPEDHKNKILRTQNKMKEQKQLEYKPILSLDSAKFSISKDNSISKFVDICSNRLTSTNIKTQKKENIIQNINFSYVFNASNLNDLGNINYTNNKDNNDYNDNNDLNNTNNIVSSKEIIRESNSIIGKLAFSDQKNSNNSKSRNIINNIYKMNNIGVNNRSPFSMCSLTQKLVNLNLNNRAESKLLNQINGDKNLNNNTNNNLNVKRRKSKFSHQSFYSRDLSSISTDIGGDIFSYPNVFYINNEDRLQLHNKVHISKFFSGIKNNNN